MFSRISELDLKDEPNVSHKIGDQKSNAADLMLMTEFGRKFFKDLLVKCRELIENKFPLS
jgi:hypothetical protein